MNRQAAGDENLTGTRQIFILKVNAIKKWNQR